MQLTLEQVQQFTKSSIKLNKMPWTTERKRELEFWKRVMLVQMTQQALVPIHKQSAFGIFDTFGIVVYHYLSTKRYRTPRELYRKFTLFDQFEIDLITPDNQAGMPAFLNDKEFLQKYRMSRESLSKLANLIKDHKAFNPNAKTCKQMNPKHQLMCLLVYLSIEGSGASNPMLRSIFKNGRGSYKNFKK